jgi:HSP20 family molecular chaperone IbpA
MEDLPNIFRRRAESRSGDVAYEGARVRFYAAAWQGGWRPALNAYRCKGGFAICVDLAGVDRSRLELTIEPRRLRIRGHRLPPEPSDMDGPVLQLLALEIDDGPFDRELALPEEVEPGGAQTEQRNGLLWIFLPPRLSS